MNIHEAIDMVTKAVIGWKCGKGEFLDKTTCLVVLPRVLAWHEAQTGEKHNPEPAHQPDCIGEAIKTVRAYHLDTKWQDKINGNERLMEKEIDICIHHLKVARDWQKARTDTPTPEPETDKGVLPKPTIVIKPPKVEPPKPEPADAGLIGKRVKLTVPGHDGFWEGVPVACGAGWCRVELVSYGTLVEVHGHYVLEELK